MYGLEAKEIQQINSVLARYPEVEKAILFGSRAKGNYKSGSDIDLALQGNRLSLSLLFEIENALDELLLPYKMDLAIYPKIENSDLIDHINRVGIPFYENSNDNWKEASLGELLSFGNGKKKPDCKGGIPIYGGNGILAYSGKSNYTGETIIIGRVGAYCGSVYYEDQPIWVSDNALSAKPKDNYDAKFLYYFLKHSNLNQYAGGSSHPLVTQTLLNSLEFEVCTDPNEQQLIASILSSLDDKIDLLHRQNKTLEAMAETLFRQWFVEEVCEGWEEHQLGEFIEVQRGLSYKGAGLAEKSEGVPMHNLNSVYEGGGYKYEGIKYYSGDFKERHKVFPGDIVITNTEQGHEHLLIGYPAIVPNLFGDFGIFSQHIYRLKIKSLLTEPFLFYLLKTSFVREQIAGSTNGSTVNMLPKDGIEWVKFRLPPEDLIRMFSESASSIISKKERNHSQIRTLSALRDTLLPKLISGEVRLKIYG